jgi:hypothetical protein
MPCDNFLLCHMSQFWTIINNHNEQWRSIFRKENNFYVKKKSQCHVSHFNEWMIINDVSIS